MGSVLPVLIGLLLAPGLGAAEAAQPPAVATFELAQHRDRTDKTERNGGLRSSLLPGEETLERFVPAEPLTVEKAKRIEARKLYTVGYMLMQRRQQEAAYDTFKKALELDPTSLPVLRRLAYLSLRIGREDEGLDYCRRALKADPNNVELLRLFAVQSEKRNDVEAAIDALERASKSPKLKTEDGPMFLEIRADLVRLYQRTGNQTGLVDALTDVIDVAENPRKYGIDIFMRRQIERRKVLFYETLGTALRKLGRYDEALAALEKGRESGVRGRRLAKAMAEVYLARGETEKALAELERAIDAEVQDERVYELYAQTLEKLGREAELAPKLAAATNKDPHNPVLRRFYARKLIEKKQFKEAEAQLLKIANEPDSLPLLAKVYREMNEPLKLLKALSAGLSGNDPRGRQVVAIQLRALAEDPDYVRKMAEAAREAIKAKKLDFLGKYLLANAADASNQVDLAVEFYRYCLDERPGAANLQQKLARVLYRNERWADVVDVCAEALKNRPRDFTFCEFQARALAKQGKADEAVGVINEFIEGAAEREELADAYLALASIHYDAKQWDKAIDVCQQILDEFGAGRRASFALYLMAGVYTHKEDLPKAEEYLLKLLDLDQQSVSEDLLATANNDLGYLWADEGKNLDRAEKMIRKAVAFDPTNAAYLDSLGWVLFKRGKFADAVDYLKQAVEQNEGADAVIWDHLGDAYLQVEKTDEAAKAWKKSIELYKEGADEDKKGKIAEIQKKLELVKTPVKKRPERADKESP